MKGFAVALLSLTVLVSGLAVAETPSSGGQAAAASHARGGAPARMADRHQRDHRIDDEYTAALNALVAKAIPASRTSR